MKKIKLIKKLSLKKDTIAKLNNVEKSQIKGGDHPIYSEDFRCYTLSHCM
jgi:hypothetical protein